MDALKQAQDIVLMMAPSYEAYLLQLMGTPFFLTMPMVKPDPDTLRLVFKSSSGEVVLYLHQNRAMSSCDAEVEYWAHPPERSYLHQEPTAKSEPKAVPNLNLLSNPHYLFGWMDKVVATRFEEKTPSAESVLLEGKFQALVGKLKARGARNPAALAAWIGRKKYGAEKFAQMSIAGRHKKAKKEAAPEAAETTPIGDFRRLAGVVSVRPSLRSESVQSELNEAYEGELEDLVELAEGVLGDAELEVAADSFDEFGEGLVEASRWLDREEDREVAEGLGDLIRGVAKGAGAVKGFKAGLKQRWSDFKSSVKSAYKSGHDKGFEKGSGRKAEKPSHEPEKHAAPKEPEKSPEPEKKAPEGGAKAKRGYKPGTRTSRKGGHVFVKQPDGSWKRMKKVHHVH